MVKKIYNALFGLMKIICACWVGKECIWETLKAVTPYMLVEPDLRIYGYFFGTVFAAAGYLGLLVGGITMIGDWAFDSCDNLILSVFPDSFAERYAKENNISYIYANAATN